MNLLKPIVDHIPHSPGVYRFLSGPGDVIYVGKAIDLKKRVSSYFRAAPQGSMRLKKLVENTADIQYSVVDSELEALILETNLIKSYRPRYNVLMKDDKNYVYVKVTLNEEFPRVYVTRFLKKDGARYFGPKSSAGSVRRTLEVLKKTFLYRHCDLFVDLRGNEKQKRDRKFAEQHERRCLGPCIMNATPEEYRQVMQQIVSFFEGKTEEIVDDLKRQMVEAVSLKAFERAAQIRDRIVVVETLMETQRVSAPDHAERDVVGLVVEGGSAYVTLHLFRNGKLLNQENFRLNAVDLESGAELQDAEILSSFLNQYYERAADFPKEILIPEMFEDQSVVEEWISNLAAHTVKFVVPSRGKNRDLLQLARDNAQSFAKQSQVKWQAGAGQNVEAALDELKTLLNLPRLPNRIECYDISHLGGTDTVGSMVVFEKGFPKKADYRHFKLRTVQQIIDDYKALEEVLVRRLRYLQVQPKEFRKPKKKELPAIVKILEREGLVHDELNPHHLIVIEKRKKFVAVGRLKPLEKEIGQLDSLWLDPSLRKEGWELTLIRALVRRQKKGKVITWVLPEAEDAYGALGFHKVEGAALENGRLQMVYRIHKGSQDASFKHRPDLLVIDGGKGQLAAVGKALKSSHVSIPVISLAKREEEIFRPGESRPLILPHSSGTLQLLQRLRDEAHRFALKYQRGLRGKRMLS